MMKALIVDDEKELSGMIALYVKEFADDVICVTNIDDAEKAVNENEIRFILCDHLVEGKGTGLDLWLRIKDREPRIPFILISGHGADVFTDLVEEGIECPPYLNKPFRKKEVKEAVAKALGLS